MCIPQYNPWCQRLDPTDSGPVEPVRRGLHAFKSAAGPGTSIRRSFSAHLNSAVSVIHSPICPLLLWPPGASVARPALVAVGANDDQLLTLLQKRVKVCAGFFVSSALGADVVVRVIFSGYGAGEYHRTILGAAPISRRFQGDKDTCQPPALMAHGGPAIMILREARTRRCGAWKHPTPRAATG